MEMVLMPADQLRSMMIEAASVALKYNPPPTISSLPQDEPLTPEETAQLLKTSKVTVWSWEKKGILTGHHLGNKKYFLRSEVMAALTRKGGAPS